MVQWLEISSWGILVWAISCLGVLVIQLIVWPDDRQKMSALLAIFMLTIVLWRLWLSYKFGIALGSTEQGIVLFLSGGATWGWFGYCSWAQNRGLYGPRLRQWRTDVARRYRCRRGQD